MTAENFAKHRNNPNIAFWRMLKKGNDHFEVTRQEPKVEVCEKRYVFDAEAPRTAGRCVQRQPPSARRSEVPTEIASRCMRSSARTSTRSPSSAAATSRPRRSSTGADGGMNPVFLAEVKRNEFGVEPTNDLSSPRRPAPFRPTVRPPRIPELAKRASPASRLRRTERRQRQPLQQMAIADASAPTPSQPAAKSNGLIRQPVWPRSATGATKARRRRPNGRGRRRPGDDEGPKAAARRRRSRSPRPAGHASAPGATARSRPSRADQDRRSASGAPAPHRRAAGTSQHGDERRDAGGPAGNFDSRWSGFR